MKPLSIYIHIPFCERRCGYCDFLSGCDLSQMEPYLEKLMAEIRAFDFSNYDVRTIYFGGGTPSLLTPAQLEKIMLCLPAGAREITLECNPNSLDKTKCAAYKRLGVNRLSIGVQSFDNDTLRDLGRLHDVKQAVDAVNLAHQYFANISIDLIKDIPGHHLVMPPATVLDHVQHISVYSLTKDDYGVLDTDEPVRLPRTFQHYEISNYARAGYQCQHNLVYWAGGEYVGFGAGAHSLLDNCRFCNSNQILDYQKIDVTPRTPEMVRREQIMLGLRLAVGFPQNLVAGQEEIVRQLVTNGFIKIKNARIVATAKGRKVLNQLYLQLAE